MIKKLNFNFYNLLFFSLPLSIILGPSISLINIFLFILIYFFKYFSKDHFKIILKDKTIVLLFLLNIYLVFNTIISIEPSNGIYRNIGFVVSSCYSLFHIVFTKNSKFMDTYFKCHSFNILLNVIHIWARYVWLHGLNSFFDFEKL